MPSPLCCVISPEMKEANEISKMIERKLKKEQKKFSLEYKLLLLGCGESGKSTFIKQMKIIHGSGYSESEARNFVGCILLNVLTAIKTIYKIMVDLEDANDDDDDNDQQCNNNNNGTVDRSYLSKIVELSEMDTITDLSPFEGIFLTAWKDPIFQKCFKRGSAYNLPDSAEYFLKPENIKRICAKDYCPTQDDIVRSRVATTGILEFLCSIKKVNFRLIDCGGQRSERRKWIHCFDGVTSIIFLASLSEYDQTLVEASSINRTIESLSLFSTILRYPCFTKTSIILFLNKYDLLEQKIKTIHIRDYLPDYTGPDCDFDAAKKYFSDKYNSCNTDENRIIYGHFTCATDTNNIKFVFEAVKDIILQNHLQEYSLV